MASPRGNHRKILLALGLSLAVAGAPRVGDGDPAEPPHAAAGEDTLERLVLGPLDASAPDVEQVLARTYAWGKGVSIGTTSTGRLSDGVPIPVDAGPLQVLPSHRARDHAYASANLVRLLTDTASALATRYPGIVLWTGDASASSGGDLAGHASHNCGRDVDLAFFVVDTEGKAVPTTHFVRCKAPDDCGDGRSFDVERSWALVETLLGDPAQELQYVFIFDPLREAILDYARGQAVPDELLARAAKVLRQPSDSARHDDHIHLRVTCSGRDRQAGCLNRGPQWPWASLHDDILSRHLDGLLTLAHARPEARPQVYARLAELEASMASAALLETVPAHDSATLEAALDAVERAGVTQQAYPALASVLALSQDETTRRRLIRLIGRTHAPLATVLLAHLAQGPEAEALTAVRALSELDRRDVVPSLIMALSHEQVAVRELAQATLRRVTNHLDPEPKGTDGWGETLQWWQRWWAAHRAETRDVWWLEGFVAQGVAMDHLEDPAAIPALIGLQLSPHDFLADNAHRVLMRTVGYWMTPTLPAQTRHERWRKWWRRNAWRHQTPAPEAQAPRAP